MTGNTTNFKKIGVVILCGGQSQRMGIDKWNLPIGKLNMLDHLIAKIQNMTQRIVVCCSNRSIVSSSKTGISIVTDEFENSGPLEGIRCGLKHLASDCEFAFVTACDIPWFQPDVVEFLLDQIVGFEAAIPVIDGRVFGMTAIYRTDIHFKIHQLIEQRRLKVSLLATELNTNQINQSQFKACDPDLNTLRNINFPEDYVEYLESVGEPCPTELKQQFGIG